MVNDLLTQNKKLREENSELREVYDDLMDTSDYMQMNTVAKELGIGHHKLMEFLRDHGVFFYNNDMEIIKKLISKRIPLAESYRTPLWLFFILIIGRKAALVSS